MELREVSDLCGHFSSGNAGPQASAALLLYLHLCHYDWMQCMFQFWLLQFPLESGTVLEGSRGGGSFGRLEGSGQVCDSALFLAMVVAKTQLWSLHIRFLLIIQTGLLQASKGKRGEVQPNSPSLCLAGAPGCVHITGLQHFFLSPLFPSPFLDRYNTFRCSDIQIS